jgi:hypothetical protein
MRTRAVALPAPRRLTVGVLALAATTVLLAWLLVASPARAQAATVRLDGVRTTLTTDPATTTLLLGAGIIPLPVWPTPITLTAHAARYSFPVTSGAVDATTLAGNVRHSGGIVLVKRNGTGWTSLSLTRFIITISKDPHLSAIVNGGKRVSIAGLDLSKAKIVRFTRHGHAYVSVSNVTVNLDAAAVGAINTTFGTSLAAPVDFGTANVLVRVAG